MKVISTIQFRNKNYEVVMVGPEKYHVNINGETCHVRSTRSDIIECLRSVLEGEAMAWSNQAKNDMVKAENLLIALREGSLRVSSEKLAKVK